MKNRHLLCSLFLLCSLSVAAQQAQTDYTQYVAGTMGCGFDGRCLPFAGAPFGMVQIAPDNITTAAGYQYERDYIFGFSHIHKNGGGGTDLLDILFLPVGDEIWNQTERTYPANLRTHITHDRETVQPGYLEMFLPDYGIDAEMTATTRCGVHRYTYPAGSRQCLAIDLKAGATHSCTIWKDEDYDTVRWSRLEIVDDYTIRGYRITNGWCPEQHVYFYARLSKPIREARLYAHRQLRDRAVGVDGLDCRGIFDFDQDDGTPLEVCVGISPVGMEGARRNLEEEIGNKTFDAVRAETHARWNSELSRVHINGGDAERRQVFYTCLYFSLLYPMAYSDVDGRYRGSDGEVHRGDFIYYAGCIGLWDAFRAQNPLITILHPEVETDLMNTMLAYFRQSGQLPIYALCGRETMAMIGYHSMPVIADVYSKGIRGYDAEALFDAMKTSACRDTFGYFLKDYRGSKNYLKYHYIPSELEINSVSKTLEYCYDDWCIAQMARMLGHQEDYKVYMERSSWWRNLFDPTIGFMRGRGADGQWTYFDPFMSNHYHKGDDFCEGTSWQWTFFVPHDGEGLIRAFGSRQRFISKLDSLFTVSSELHGEHVAEDITGMVGQYAHGNEPSHHTIYMYNYAGQPWKTQQRAMQMMYDMYQPTPTGMCGQEDTGQMSAWLVFSAMGFYPVTHGQAEYFLGTPLFPDFTLQHPRGTLRITAPGVSRTRCYVQSLKVNGKPYRQTRISHDTLFSGDTTLEFVMGDKPNTRWFK